MSNLNITQDFILNGRRNRPGRANPMLFVAVHETGNTRAGAGARNHASYLKGDDAAAKLVSWHYTVDDREIFQHLPENEDAFHAGDGAGPGNRQSIGIETATNSDGDFLKAVERTAELTADVCRRRNIPIENVRQHFAFTGKNCPQNIRAGRPFPWATFLDKVRAYLGNQSTPTPPPTPTPPKPAPPDGGMTVQQIADGMRRGDFGNGWDNRVRVLSNPPHNYPMDMINAARDIVNGRTPGSNPAPTPAPAPSQKPQFCAMDLARRIKRGEFGNEPQRTRNLTAAGFTNVQIQQARALINSGHA